MDKRGGKKQLEKNNFYYKVFDKLKSTTNLTDIQKDLNISKQNLNYYLNKLWKLDYISKKGNGYYEVKKGKNLTKYENLLPKDFTRGHAYVWNIKFKEIPNKWKKRIEILNNNNTHYKLVGALKTTPRIKVLGRKIWLCNNHIRIFDKKNSSYYGENAIESRNKAFEQLYLIVGALERKLGVNLDYLSIEWCKEHYSLIKNDLAIDQNNKGIIWRIKDEQGEWLIIDDSLDEGGEFENNGKGSFTTNLELQKYWNDMKNTNFKVTPSFLMESINKVTMNQQIFAENMKSHIEAIQKLGKGVEDLNKLVKELKNHKS